VRVLIAGCGYVGLPLGAELVRRGHEVSGIRRSPDAQQELLNVGIKPLVADIAVLEDLQRIEDRFDWVVNCVASSGGTVEDYRRTYLRGTNNLIDWLRSAPPRRFIYTSSTSVYGQNDGSTVTETSPTEPGSESGKVLVATEQLLLAAGADVGFEPVILRLAGIYGPGRGYWLRQFLHGEATIEGDGSRILNMIHRDDVIGAVLTSLEADAVQSVYNVSDDEPVSQRVMLEWLANRLNRPMPPQAATLKRKRGSTNKRVANQRLKAELRYELRYPTFREGFEAELRRMGVV
jgi:nucleoside-diphosphate-sugar epimerase